MFMTCQHNAGQKTKQK